MGVPDSIRLVKSPNLIAIPVGRGYLVYNSLEGGPVVLNEEGYSVLALFGVARSLKEVRKDFTITGLGRWVKKMVDWKFLIQEGADERVYFHRKTERAIKRIARGQHLISLGLVLDEACNFNCSYCVSKKLIVASGRSASGMSRMTWEVAQKSLDSFFAYARDCGHKKLEIYFGGSEPLLNWSVLQKTIEYCHSKYNPEFGFRFSMNTNASLITQERAVFLANNRVTVTSSLDGPEVANDAVRTGNSNKDTFTRIIAGWDHLGDNKRRVEWFCLTLTDDNIDAIDESFFDFLASRKIRSCSFEPDLINPLKRDPEELVSCLLRFKEWGEVRKITVGGLWCKPFQNMFSRSNKPNLFNCSAFTGRGISVLPSGEVVLCTYSATKIGAVEDLKAVFKSRAFMELLTSRAVGNIEECHGCEIEGLCMGGCYLTPEYCSLIGSDNAFRYRCALYKIATRRLLHMACR